MSYPSGPGWGTEFKDIKGSCPQGAFVTQCKVQDATETEEHSAGLPEIP